MREGEKGGPVIGSRVLAEIAENLLVTPGTTSRGQSASSRSVTLIWRASGVELELTSAPTSSCVAQQCDSSGWTARSRLDPHPGLPIGATATEEFVSHPPLRVAM